MTDPICASPPDGPQPDPDRGDPAEEARISAMVARFYELCLADDLLGPMFRAAIPDLAPHMVIVEDFWSHALLGTHRYQRGTPYSHHTRLSVVEQHFDRWMAAFATATHECLSPDMAELAMKRAAHMTKSFKMGMLPLPEVKVSAGEARP
ncbi:hemoglobin [Novosphingobium sp. SG751A]|uniref:group III truncated hemoglobin n=1 Tax=Novosphingobium sp. SG751A TaxID=2587000 RepID=UPI0015552E9C|nr:group III truncated hemoglobin [Novosphingobium sp. SG751A]NOW48484.1 hemoglobin [Novosphingobium sp. SG751A]